MRIDLTSKTILKLPLPAENSGPVDHADSGVKGLCLTARSTGSRSWTYRYRIGNGNARIQRRLTIGAWPEMEVEEARERASAVRKLIRSGIDPIAHAAEQARLADDKRRSRDELTFARLAERFIIRQKGRDRRSWKSQARTLGFRIKSIDASGTPTLEIIAGGLAHRWRETPLASIERLDVTIALDELLDAGLPHSANMRLSILKSFYSWAIDSGYVDRSPVDKRKAPAEKVTRERVLSDDELRLLWRATEDQSYPVRQFIRLLLLTGARRIEVAGMQFSEVAGSDWTIPAERSKNKRAHKLPLSPAAMAEIASADRYCRFVLTTTARSSISGFSTIKERVDARMARLANVEIPEWRFHDLRRTVASGMASLGTPPHVIERVLNHVSGEIKGVALTYNRYDYRLEMREALCKWADHLAKIVDAQSLPAPSKVVALVPA